MIADMILNEITTDKMTVNKITFFISFILFEAL